ncbi:MAG: discoidin domain-containing protein, partial [Phycisphaerales bacterium]
MYRKTLLLILVAAFCLTSSAYAATIVWVSDNKTPASGVPADQAWVDLLEAQGYTVDLSFRNQEGRTLDAAKIAALNAADLIIISRDTNSGDYANGQEPTQWNSVTTPIIMQIGHIARNNRWLWLDTDSYNDAQPTMQAVATAHPIFTGVALNASNQVEVLTTNTSIVNTAAVGNGTLIATRADNNQVWIAEWQVGQVFYSGAGQTAAGQRLLFCSGGTSGVSDGTYNLTAEGEKLFINAVRYLLGEIGGPGQSSDPNPADQATDVPRDVVLSWTPGDYAPPVNGHTVYLSESFNDVNDGLGGITESASSYDPGRLNLGATYYWRVDEVNAPPDSTVYPGAVWSFTTEPIGYPIDGANITATASSTGQPDFGPEKTIDGSGLDANDLHSVEATDMWLSGNEPLGAWIQYELDKVYKLHEMWVWNSNQVLEAFFGFGMKDVTVEYSTNGADWTALAGVPEFAGAPGTADYAHDTTVDFGGAAAKYVRLTATSNWGGVLPQYGLSEVRLLYIPVSARKPSPDSGAADVDVDATLSWRAGREAATHDVYLSTDEQAVIDGNTPAVSVTDASYSSDLDLGNTYFWRIDEVNDVETPTTWQGDVWSFSTPEYLVVDGFEDYNDYPPDEIYSTWLDGY